MSRRLPKRSAPPVVRERPSRRWLPASLIVVAGALVYANSLRGPFVLDDGRAIAQNESIRSLSSLGAVLHPPNQSPVTGRPLANLTFALNYAYGGERVVSFHVVNVAIHVLTGLTLFGVLRRTFSRGASRGPAAIAGPVSHRVVALMAALVWVVHPLNTEPVNYVTQRTELLMGLFFLLTVYAAIRAVDGARRWEWIACASAFAAVGSKETALTLPVVLLLWDRVFAFGSLAEAWNARRRLYVMTAASWLLFALFARELPFFQERGFEEQVSRWTYLLNQAPIIVHYLTLSVWPSSLTFDYGVAQPLSLSAALPFAIVVLLLLAATLIALGWWAPLGFWGAWFFVTLAPTSSIIPLPTEVGAERRMYLPLVALVALSALAVQRGLARGGSERLPVTRARVTAVIASLAIIGLGTVTVLRNRDYKDPLRLWQSVLDRQAHPRAHEHISMYLRDAGRTDEALAHLRTAAPDSPTARLALASALLERGDVAGAIPHFRQFVTENPHSRQIIAGREEFGIALMRAGDPSGAAEQFREITRIAPTYARGYVALADALVQANDFQGAIAAYRQALKVQPDNVVALANLGVILAGRGDADAVPLLEKALALEPRALPPRKHLARLRFARGEYEAMASEAQQLTSMAPGDPEGYNLLGIALASQQRFAAAAEQFEQALRLDPANQNARANLARLRAMAPAPQARSPQ